MDSVFDIAAREDTRQAFVNFIETAHPEKPERNAEMSAYILSAKCPEDILRLKDKDYFFDTPEGMTKYVGKERLFFSLPPNQKYLCSLLKHAALMKYDGYFSDNLYSHRHSKGNVSALVSIKNTPGFEDLFLLTADIQNFSPSVRYKDLSSAIDSFFFDDKDFCDFLKWFAKGNEYLVHGEVHHTDIAIKDGIPLSGLYENVFLSELDGIIEKRASFYSRFADDMLIGTKSMEDLEKLRKEIDAYLKERDLSLHPDKTKVIEKGSAFIYTGMQVQGNTIDFPEQFVEMVLRTIKVREKELARKQRIKKLPPQLVMTMVMSGVRQFIDNYQIKKAFDCLSTDRSLKKMDRALADLIRAAVCGTTGCKRYALSYDTLKKWGYKSLVNEYYRSFGRKSRFNSQSP